VRIDKVYDKVRDKVFEVAGKIMRVGLIVLLFCAWLQCQAQNGVSMKTQKQTQEALGCTNCVWNGDSVLFSNETDSVRFYPGRRRADVNGCTVWLNVLPEGNVSNGDWRIGAIDLDYIKLGILTATNSEPKTLHVMLDAGHGGMDDGASSRAPFVMSEKHLTLDMTRLVGVRLEEAGMRVSYTRTNDVALALDERSLAARKAKADIFVSVHANFSPNPLSTGAETFVINPAGYAGTPEGSRARGFQIGNANDYYNTQLGYSIQRRLVEMDPTVPDRGLKRQSFFVLRETSCPAVLIEIGFLSNASELLKMLEPEWMDYCADAIADGILDYAEKKDALDVAVREKREREFAWKKAKEEKAKVAAATKPPVPVVAPLIAQLVAAEPLLNKTAEVSTPEKKAVQTQPTNSVKKTVIEVKPREDQKPAATNASPPSIFDFYSKK
jgi:N-acetylmuramoyl-L-alanine amidase